jgi:hypothetical protein
MRLDPQGRGAVYITIVNVVDNDDDNEFVNVAFFLQLPPPENRFSGCQF